MQWKMRNLFASRNRDVLRVWPSSSKIEKQQLLPRRCITCSWSRHLGANLHAKKMREDRIHYDPKAHPQSNCRARPNYCNYEMDGGFIPEPEQEAERVTGNRNSDQNQFRSAPFQPPPSQEWGQQERGTGFGTGCSKCSSLSYSDEYFKAFNVFLCNQCRRGEKLISKVSFFNLL